MPFHSESVLFLAILKVQNYHNKCQGCLLTKTNVKVASSQIQQLSRLPLDKDKILSKVERVVVPRPVHHIQQFLFVSVRKFH